MLSLACCATATGQHRRRRHSPGLRRTPSPRLRAGTRRSSRTPSRSRRVGRKPWRLSARAKIILVSFESLEGGKSNNFAAPVGGGGHSQSRRWFRGRACTGRRGSAWCRAGCGAAACSRAGSCTGTWQSRPWWWWRRGCRRWNDVSLLQVAYVRRRYLGKLACQTKTPRQQLTAGNA